MLAEHPTCRPRRRAPSPASCWGRSATCRPSRCAASPPTRAATSSPSARSSTRCSRAGALSAATPPRTRCRRSCGRTLRTSPLTNQDVPPGLERIVRHCLEKSPEQRFHSAHDVAFDLEALSTASGPAMPAPALGPRRFRWAPLGAALAALAFAAAAYVLARRGAEKAPLSFQQLTFRRGYIPSARFGPDGQTFVFTASWDGALRQVFSGRPGSAEHTASRVPGRSRGERFLDRRAARPDRSAVHPCLHVGRHAGAGSAGRRKPPSTAGEHPVGGLGARRNPIRARPRRRRQEPARVPGRPSPLHDCRLHQPCAHLASRRSRGLHRPSGPGRRRRVDRRRRSRRPEAVARRTVLDRSGPRLGA